MAIIRQIEISRFRGIRHLVWQPRLGINCLIGPGDSGKSTILDAIDLTLGARRRVGFTDADFHGLDVDQSIEIKVTIGMLDEPLKDIDSYGLYHCGWDSVIGKIEPEPAFHLETVLTVMLTVGSDLEPVWTLLSTRAEAQAQSRNLAWAHRIACAPTRLGPHADEHFSWGLKSVLNRLSEDRATASNALAHAARTARKAFADQGELKVEQTLVALKEVADELGVPVKDPQALLDLAGMSFSASSIAVHDGEGIPVRSLGLGSARLLIAGMQHRAAAAQITLIDEVEHGLEPYRIIRLLHKVGTKAKDPTNQVFMTTHSPVVLRELSAEQLFVVRVPPLPAAAAPELAAAAPMPPDHLVLHAGDADAVQATLRACAEAFLTPNVVVCEGKTEMGLGRGHDLHCGDCGQPSMSALGAYLADGGGDNTFRRAITFARLGYRTAILRDADKNPTTADLKEASDLGIEIFQWEPTLALENQLFKSVPQSCINSLLDMAVERCGTDAVEAHIQALSHGKYSLKQCREEFKADMRPALGASAKKYNWYKDIDPAERIGRDIIGPNLAECEKPLRDVFEALSTWIGRTAVPEAGD